MKEYQCIGCEHIWEGELGESGLIPCPSCGEVDELLFFTGEGVPIMILRSGRTDDWDRANAFYLQSLKGSTIGEVN